MFYKNYVFFFSEWEQIWFLQSWGTSEGNNGDLGELHAREKFGRAECSPGPVWYIRRIGKFLGR